jgi:coatomer protein complex subunit alpha (xenin)
MEDDVWAEIAKRGFQDPDSEPEHEPSEEEESDEMDMDNFDGDLDDAIDLGEDIVDDGAFDDFGMELGEEMGDDFNLDDEEIDMDNIDADILPRASADFRAKWTSVSDDVTAAVCAGDFNGAMTNYVAQYRVSNFAPLKEHFIRCFQASGAEIPGIPSTSNLSVPILEPPQEDEQISGRPAVPFSIDSLQKMRNDALKTIDGFKNLDEGLQKFRDCLYASLFTYTSAEEANRVQKIQKYAQTYISAIRLMQQIQKTSGAEQLALRLHLLTYELHIRDRQMPLFDAIKLANKLGYYLTTSQLCREYFRLIKSTKGKGIKPGFKKLAGKIKQLNAQCEKKNSEAEGLAYDVQMTRQEQSVCPLSFQVVKCEVGKTFESTFDVDQFAGKFKGKISPTCNLCKVGARGTRL